MVHRILLSVLLAALVVSCATSPSPAPASRPVSLVSLLEEMTNRAALAELPAPPFTLQQASSYERTTTNALDEKTWFANRDFSQFIRVETNDARREWVIQEHEGPGAVVRFWLPLHPPKDEQIIRYTTGGGRGHHT